MHSDYANPVLQQHRDQLIRGGQRDQFVTAAARAEHLLVKLSPGQYYSPEVVFRAVYQHDAPHTLAAPISGEATAHDLRRLIEDLTNAADLLADELGEPVYTVQSLSKQLNVSTKTINRWREQGLVSRRLIFDGRKRVGFLASSVEHFVADNKRRVQRAQRFHQLSAAERREIIDHADQLARVGDRSSEIINRIAKRMKRSSETIRTTLKQHAQKNPDSAILIHPSMEMTDDAKQRLYSQYRRGKSIESLANVLGRSAAAVQRIINQVRATKIFDMPLDYIDNEQFAQPGSEAEILAPTPQPETPSRKVKAPSDFPAYLAALYDTPLLTRNQEQHLFRKYNYLKYKASQLRDQLDPARPKTRRMDQIESLYEQAIETKNQITQANLRLVVSLARKRVGICEDFYELVSDGNVSLMRAVEKFNYALGNKFSTYATWAIVKNFARSIPAQLKQQSRYRTSQDEMLSARVDFRVDQRLAENEQSTREEYIGTMLSCLDQREQQIIIRRYGLDHSVEPKTLKEIGAELGVTKERIRQIEARAIRKLREAARENRIELSA